ncbi:MAG: hypothetical protein U0231_14425 [Nitrospiraceae bacterium]
MHAPFREGANRHRLQEVVLFDDTIRNNIGYGSQCDAAEVEAAARLAFAHEFIEKLPQGYETVIGERGLRLPAVNVNDSRSPAPSRGSADSDLDEATGVGHAIRTGRAGWRWPT